MPKVFQYNLNKRKQHIPLLLSCIHVMRCFIVLLIIISVEDFIYVVFGFGMFSM